MTNEEEFTLRLDPKSCQKCHGTGKYRIVTHAVNGKNGMPWDYQCDCPVGIGQIKIRFYDEDVIVRWYLEHREWCESITLADLSLVSNNHMLIR